MSDHRISPDEIVRSIDELLDHWDEAATPTDDRGMHNGAGFARDNWLLIRADLRWLMAHVDVLEASSER